MSQSRIAGRNGEEPAGNPATVGVCNGIDWLIWQLADSALPTGGFAHSSGLEAAWQHGEVSGPTGLCSFIESSLYQLGSATLPFINAAHREPGRLDEIDELCETFTTNHVTNRASRAQGRALFSVIRRILPETASALTAPPFAHFAPVFGAILRRLEIPHETTLRLFCFQHLRGLFAAAVRLGIIGPLEAQSLQLKLAPSADATMRRSLPASLDQLAQPAPLLDIWQGSHDRLYSRLFQS